ncbi:MAG: hypothetical protein JWM41_2859 [Gemmatimonadetes bacterium]|nr:hypothetical protein [Gemmatimonadota bacterium]
MMRWKHIQDLDEPSDTYLSRLMLFKTRWLGVYFHIIRRPDYARCEHDHPWAFVTLILRGGYEEEVEGKKFMRRPGYVGYRPRSFEHRITQLPKGTAWSLVIRGPDHVEWGFRTLRGRVSWQEYVSWPGIKRVLWCDDRSRPTRARAERPMSAKPSVERDPEEAAGKLATMLAALVDQARLTPKTTPFMAAQIDEIISLAACGIADSQRLEYLAEDRENLRALYDLMENSEGDDEDGPAERLRSLLDEFIEMDEEDDA